MTWERDKVVFMRGKVSTRVLKSDRQFRNHKTYSTDRTKTEEKCVYPVRGVFNPRISSKTDESRLAEEMKRLGERFGIGISNMKNSYTTMLREVYEQSREEKGEKSESKSEIGE